MSHALKREEVHGSGEPNIGGRLGEINSEEYFTLFHSQKVCIIMRLVNCGIEAGVIHKSLKGRVGIF